MASIKRIMSGNKLAYKEANHLIRSLMYAFIVSDGEHVEEVKLDEFPPEGSQERSNEEENKHPLTQNQSQSEPTQPPGSVMLKKMCSHQFAQGRV